MTAGLDWNTIIVSAIGSGLLGGGGLIAVLITRKADTRKWEQEREDLLEQQEEERQEQQRKWELEREESRLQWELERERLMAEAKRRDEVDRLAAKTDLRKAADTASIGVIEGLVLQSERDNKRMDRIEKRNEELVTQLADAHHKLRIAEQAHMDAERRLLLADEADARQKAFIARQKDIIVTLENTIAELRAQVERLTQALADCARHESDEEPRLTVENGHASND